MTLQSIKTKGRAEEIIFSGETGPYKRSQQTVGSAELIIPEVIDAIKRVFPGCKSITAKILKSTKGDVPQALHQDYSPAESPKAIKSLSRYHYSAVISFDNDTRLIIGDKNEEICIPRLSMIFFRGDMSHAGAGYTKSDVRLFLSISSDLFPESENVHLVGVSTCN